MILGKRLGGFCVYEFEKLENHRDYGVKIIEMLLMCLAMDDMEN